MKIKNILLNATFFLAIALMVQSCGSAKKESKESEASAEEAVEEESVSSEPVNNTLTEAEKAEGWILLFDGETPGAWRGYQKENFPAAWNVEDGALHIQGSGRGEVGSKDGGDIIYPAKKFGEFHYKLEWKVSEGGNSGIFYLGQEIPEFDYIWKSAPEMQVLDNVNHPDANKGKDGNRQAGSLYDLIPAQPQNAKAVGEWNQVEIIVKDRKVKHIQNGEVVVEYDIESDEFKELIKDSKWPPINPNWADFTEAGYFGLQDHGDDAWFRNIKVKPLESESEPAS
ncbi:MAG: DUF1080 domain-containing protein [Bacteroidota bacterium]